MLSVVRRAPAAAAAAAAQQRAAAAAAAVAPVQRLGARLSAAAPALAATPARGFASRRRTGGGGSVSRRLNREDRRAQRAAAAEQDERDEEDGMEAADGDEEPDADAVDMLRTRGDDPFLEEQDRAQQDAYPEEDDDGLLQELEDPRAEEAAFARAVRGAKRDAEGQAQEGEDVLPRRDGKKQAQQKKAAKKREPVLPDPSLGDAEQILADVAAMSPEEVAGMGSRMRDYVAAVKARRVAELEAQTADRPHAKATSPAARAAEQMAERRKLQRAEAARAEEEAREEDPFQEGDAEDMYANSHKYATPLVSRQFFGFRYRVRDPSPLATAMDQNATIDRADLTKGDSEVQTELPSYDEEYDPHEHWREKTPWRRAPPPDEYISHKGETYKVGGESMPPTQWRGHTWLTFGRSWDDLRANGVEPSMEEIQRFLDYTLGKQRPRTEPINPPLQPRPLDFPTPGSIEGSDKRVDTSLLQTEDEWRKWGLANNKPRTWFQEARLQYKKKMHLTRVAYLEEYRRVQSLHDANLRARWAQQMQQRAERVAWKQARAVRQAVRNQAYYDQWMRRRARLRIKSRARRMDKDYKIRRTTLHQFNFLLRERAQHWIQPKFSAAPAGASGATTGSAASVAGGRVEHSVHLSPKLFERQEFVVGFWPLPLSQDGRERALEQARREATKQ